MWCSEKHLHNFNPWIVPASRVMVYLLLRKVVVSRHIRLVVECSVIIIGKQRNRLLLRFWKIRGRATILSLYSPRQSLAADQSINAL
jgi:hypothetical protein